MRHGNGIRKLLLQIPLSIPILPMRHGNKNNFRAPSFSMTWFRSYLWGMETVFWLPLHIVLDQEIPILPMRHGNEDTRGASRADIGIPILPMRHGNSPAPHYLHQKSAIPILPMRHGNNFASSNQAYAGSSFRSYLWGMETRSSLFIQFWFVYSDPTYEAWKLMFGLLLREL